MQNRNRRFEKMKIFKLERQFEWPARLPKKILNLKCELFHFLLVFILGKKSVLFSQPWQIIVLYRQN